MVSPKYAPPQQFRWVKKTLPGMPIMGDLWCELVGCENPHEYEIWLVVTGTCFSHLMEPYGHNTIYNGDIL